MNYILTTIDVEALRSLSRLGNFDQLIMGEIGNKFFGTTKIAEIIKQYDGSGTFYIDFAEHEHGIEKLKHLSQKVLDLGSDVQLHIHPQFIADQNRYLMHQYSKDEQSEIFNKCIDIYKKCVNENPLSFRAGGYGADNNTLELLSEKGILIDSSYFKDHKWCKISDLPINKVSVENKLIEIPVTIFMNNISYKFSGITLKTKSIIKKLDIDGCSKEELKLGFDSLKSNNVRIIILFLHSFSLFNRSYDYSSITPDFSNIDKLKFILEYASKEGYKISSIKNIKDEINNYLNDQVSFPKISTNRSAINSSAITFNKFLKRKFRGK